MYSQGETLRLAVHVAFPEGTENVQGNNAPETVYDALMIPALNYAELDRLEERLTPEEETSVFVATRELMADAAGLVRSVGAEQQDPEQPRTLPALRATVLRLPGQFARR